MVEAVARFERHLPLVGLGGAPPVGVSRGALSRQFVIRDFLVVRDRPQVLFQEVVDRLRPPALAAKARAATAAAAAFRPARRFIPRHLMRLRQRRNQSAREPKQPTRHRRITGRSQVEGASQETRGQGNTRDRRLADLKKCIRVCRDTWTTSTPPTSNVTEAVRWAGSFFCSRGGIERSAWRRPTSSCSPSWRWFSPRLLFTTQRSRTAGLNCKIVAKCASCGVSSAAAAAAVARKSRLPWG